LVETEVSFTAIFLDACLGVPSVAAHEILGLCPPSIPPWDTYKAYAYRHVRKRGKLYSRSFIESVDTSYEHIHKGRQDSGGEPKSGYQQTAPGYSHNAERRP
jgi:hypothetical protein